jgi:hypothetical protein
MSRYGCPGSAPVQPLNAVTVKVRVDGQLDRGSDYRDQTSIEHQFEFIQRNYANNPNFVGGKRRPGGAPVTPGFDPIIGQAQGGGPRAMDEAYPNYPAGNRRTALTIPKQFVELTAAAYFFMPSITALRTVLT